MYHSMLCIFLPELFWGLGTGEESEKFGNKCSFCDDDSSPADASLEVDSSLGNSWFFFVLSLPLILCPCEYTLTYNLSSKSMFKSDEISARCNIFIASE